MKNASLLIILCFGIIVHSTLSAQYYTNQNKVWAFGTNAGLDFTSGFPVSIHTNINTHEGCASVSSSSGKLLFYTDGKTVYNRNGDTMPSGTSIVWFKTFSTLEAAVITPVIGTTDKYYIFSLENGEGTTTGHNHLAYSIVDMSLASGLGDVITTSMGMPLDDSLSEGMTAIAGNNNNIWLVTHRRDTNMFVTYNITSMGISTPIYFTTGTASQYSGCYSFGMLKASPNRKKLVHAVHKWVSGCSYGVDLYDFDPNTGKISNGILIDTFTDNYGVEFSPDNSKVYLFEDSHEISQRNIALSSSSAIIASRYIVCSGNSDLKLGPDNKIYFAGSGNMTMDCINAPNASGVSCNYLPSVVPLLSGTRSQVGLPHLFVVPDTSKVVIDNISNVVKLDISPNPATKELTISSTNTITQITVANLIGIVVYNREYNTEKVQIDIANIPAGVYFVKINNTEVRRFVKQ